jgi:hypothetical protein
MKGFLRTLCPLFAIILLATGIGWADLSKDEKNLEREAKRLDDTASRPDGENAVVKKIASEFKVNDAQVQTLRNSRLGYGEISIVLSLAQTMPGGITEANIQKVLAIRRGPPVA